MQKSSAKGSIAATNVVMPSALCLLIPIRRLYPASRISPDLPPALQNHLTFPLSFEERIQALKTRQLTYACQPCAAIWYSVCARKIFPVEGRGSYALYAQILGFRRQEQPSALSCLHKKAASPYITKMADAARTSPVGARAAGAGGVRLAFIADGADEAQRRISKMNIPEGLVLYKNGASFPKSNVRETWRVILVSEATTYSIQRRHCASRQTFISVGDPPPTETNLLLHMPPKEVGLFSTEIKLYK